MSEGTTGRSRIPAFDAVDGRQCAPGNHLGRPRYTRHRCVSSPPRRGSSSEYRARRPDGMTHESDAQDPRRAQVWASAFADHQARLARSLTRDGSVAADVVQETSANQPHQTLDGQPLYPSLLDRAVALAFGLAMNNAFVDGNKRVAHAALETTLVINGWELNAPVDDQEQLLLDLAAGRVNRDQLLAQIRTGWWPWVKRADRTAVTSAWYARRDSNPRPRH
ncbi:MAG: hypothetical protein GY711_24025 [bacterium]|nr:hypothetical protein [bacterium]